MPFKQMFTEAPQR